MKMALLRSRGNYSKKVCFPLLSKTDQMESMETIDRLKMDPQIINYGPNTTRTVVEQKLNNKDLVQPEIKTKNLENLG